MEEICRFWASGVVALSLGTLPTVTNAEPQGETVTPPVQGYSDTPLIPGTDWHVHDPTRPQPVLVTGTTAVTTPPPSDAIVLFDGTNLDHWVQADGQPAHWRVGDGIAQRSETGGGIRTRDTFGDVQLHIEFRSPNPEEGSGQRRGNSGIFFMGRYEVQVLDSSDNPTYPDGQAGALYGQRPPLVNPSAPSGEWQSYDIIFEAPSFVADGALAKPAYVTIFHNGVLVQHRVPYQGATSHRRVAQYKAHASEAPITLQDHGQTVHFRNIWARRLDLPQPPIVPQMMVSVTPASD